MSLTDYKEIVGTSALITTMGQMLAGTVICKDIHKNGSTKGFDPLPFILGMAMCLLMLQYGYILGESVMININLFGIFTNIVYTLIYYFYSPDKNHTLGLIGKVAIFTSVFLGYAQWEHPDHIQYRFGMIVTIILLLLIASPLLHLGEIIRTKSTKMLPFPLILMGTLVSSQWLLYGLIIDDAFTIFQNAVGFTLNAVQLSLFAIYPSTPSPSKTSSKKDK